MELVKGVECNPLDLDVNKLSTTTHPTSLDEALRMDTAAKCIQRVFLKARLFPQHQLEGQQIDEKVGMMEEKVEEKEKETSIHFVRKEVELDIHMVEDREAGGIGAMGMFDIPATGVQHGE
eukprot:gnl/Chilomastix_caulleri/2001.p1 GENE.gnl/Chilomastix_caulleri/2001~~gnl/Chilomastix_caulleri/2001.p1  ORF type:complete len:133 (+),score=55.62 gnl/Chilomastix_caulleri/2001:39-401(+)